MSEKIYEYKDDQDWLIACWGDQAQIRSLDDQENYDQIRQALKPLLPETGAFMVTVVKGASDFRLISLVVEMINEQTDRKLSVQAHQGAILVSEDQRLLVVHLPKEGLDQDQFFGNDSSKTSIGDTILIATRNEGKTKEFRQMFEKIGLKVENLNDHPDLPEVEETGMTFEENARLKAETIAKLTGKMVLADDSGLKVDALGGLPGVWSARFSGPDATDQSNNAKLLHELAMVFDMDQRSAQFHTTLVVAAPDKESLVVEADWPGYIGMEEKGDNGFGYDPLFLVGETGRTAAQLTDQEKNAQSHRGLAVKKLMEVFPKWQQKQS